MPELDAFERSLQSALREFAERGVLPVDPVGYAAQVSEQPQPRLPIDWHLVRRSVWLLLMAALLGAFLASVLYLGAQPTDDRAVLIRVFELRDASVVALSPDGRVVAAASSAAAATRFEPGMP
jgi:hypothetical protein